MEYDIVNFEKQKHPKPEIRKMAKKKDEELVVPDNIGSEKSENSKE
jgi:hypothetical protein